MHEKPLKIFVSAPYHADHIGELQRNVESAIDAGVEVWKSGHYPYIPHAMRFAFPFHRALKPDFDISLNGWIKWHKPWLMACDAILYLDSSEESDYELKLMKKSGKRVFSSLDEIPKVKRKINPKKWKKEYFDVSDLLECNSEPNSRMYVAGPYTGKTGYPIENEANTLIAFSWALKVNEKGYEPYVPHFSHFIDMRHKLPWREWMMWDRIWIGECDTFFMFAPSKGARMERDLAEKLGKKLFERIEDIPDVSGKKKT
jgi:hypothetical protein